ncbi:MAG: MgtC/SapB family protein [Phycisphaeraceae bacterium]
MTHWLPASVTAVPLPAEPAGGQVESFAEWARYLGDLGRWAEQLEVVILVTVAGLLGGVIGWEREMAHKPAGLRTHMFVAGAAAFLTLLGDVVVEQFLRTTLTTDSVRTDPVRIIQAIIIGISFLGGGTIIQRSRSRVEGLTTAASLFLVATIGIAVALRQLVAAFVLSLIIVIVLYVVGTVERRMGKYPPVDREAEDA